MTIERTFVKFLVCRLLLNHSSYESSSEMALEFLTDAVIYYLQKLAGRCHELAELSGRTVISFLDIQHGFSLFKIQTRDLQIYFNKVKHEKQLPYSTLEKEVSTIPKEKKKSSLFIEFMKEDAPDPLPAYIPPFCVPFPEKHSYKRTPVYQYREQDYGKVREMAHHQAQELNQSLKALVKKCNQVLVDVLDFCAVKDHSLENNETEEDEDDEMSITTDDEKMDREEEWQLPFDLKKMSRKKDKIYEIPFIDHEVQYLE